MTDEGFRHAPASSQRAPLTTSRSGIVKQTGACLLSGLRTCIARTIGAEAAVVKAAIVEAAEVAAAVLAACACRPGAVVAVAPQRRAAAAGQAQVRP